MRLLGPVAALLVAGCTSSATTNDATAPTTSIVVMPEGAGPYIATGASGSDDNCVDSLRPAGPPPPPTAPVGPAVDRIRASGKLRAGVDQNTLNWAYYDPATQRLQGFDIDMVLRVAQALFGTADLESAREHVTFRVVPNADRMKVVHDGSVDLVAQTMTTTCARRTDPTNPVAFSATYFHASQDVLVSNDSGIDSVEGLNGKRVCATKGSTSIARVAQIDGTTPVQANNQTDCLVMLQQGQVDAVSTDNTILQGFADQDPHLRLLGVNLRDEPYGIAVSQDNPDLTRFVNAVLAANPQRWADSYTAWLCPSGVPKSCTAPTQPTPTYAG
jgi:polar amino acid transport system substrate-binding protein